MAITVQYGPIASALGLAQVAGAGQGFQIQSQRDLQALQIQNQLQQTQNQYAENQAQTALAYQQLQGQQQQAQQQDAQNQAYRNAELQLGVQSGTQAQERITQQGQDFTQEQQTRQQQADELAKQRTQQDQDRATKQAWLSGLSPDQRDIVNSGGHLPNSLEVDAAKRQQQSAQTDAAYKQANALKDQITILQKQLDPINGTQDPAERAAIPGQLQTAYQQYNKTIDGINAATGSQAPQQQATPAMPQGGAGRAGGTPSSALPDAEKAKLLLSVSQQLGLPPDDPKVIAMAARMAPTYALQFQQSQQNRAVAGNAQSLAAQNQVNVQQSPQQQFQNPAHNESTAY